MSDDATNILKPCLDDGQSLVKEPAALNAPTVLAKYKSVGEDHPTYKKLTEALSRKQNDAARDLMRELDLVLAPDKANPPEKTKETLSFPWWNGLWVVFLSLALMGGVMQYYNHNFKAAVAKLQPKSTTTDVSYLGSEMLSGKTSQILANRIVEELIKLNPDNILFVGHQLAKREIVEYLSAVSRNGRVRILIGSDLAGQNQLEDVHSPLRQFAFTALRIAKYPISTQTLLAFNTRTKQAIAFIGTYPFDIQEASRGENLTLLIRGYDQCLNLYTLYDKLLPADK
jgi:hypothetical protein